MSKIRLLFIILCFCATGASAQSSPPQIFHLLIEVSPVYESATDDGSFGQYLVKVNFKVKNIEQLDGIDVSFGEAANSSSYLIDNFVCSKETSGYFLKAPGKTFKITNNSCVMEYYFTAAEIGNVKWGTVGVLPTSNNTSTQTFKIQ